MEPIIQASAAYFEALSRGALGDAVGAGKSSALAKAESMLVSQSQYPALRLVTVLGTPPSLSTTPTGSRKQAAMINASPLEITAAVSVQMLRRYAFSSSHPTAL
jgi:hypothetical protein